MENNSFPHVTLIVVLGYAQRPFVRRGAGVAELAALEMLCTGNRTVGSNPTLSASHILLESTPMKKRFLLAMLIVATAAGALGFTARGKAQNGRGQVCGDPTMRCPGGGENFSAHDLQFRIPRNAV